MKGDPLENLLVKGETRTLVVLLPRTQKILIKLYAKWQLVWQLAQADKGYKICHLVGLKKRKAPAIVCVFYEKRRL